MGKKRWLFQLYKRTIIWLRYYLHAVSKFVLSRTSLFIFILAFLVFFVIAFPKLLGTIANHPYFQRSPMSFEVSGVITREDVLNEEIIIMPISDAEILIGGFSTSTTNLGKYKLQITSMDMKNVPMIIIIDGEPIIEYIDFFEGDYYYEFDLKVPAE